MGLASVAAATTEMIAQCRASGRIEIGVAPLKGAIPIALGPEAEIREAIEATAARGDDGACFVPGFPFLASHAAIRAIYQYRSLVLDYGHVQRGALSRLADPPAVRPSPPAMAAAAA